MEFFYNAKVFLKIGPFQITWYALCFVGGALMSCLIAKWLYKNQELDKKQRNEILDDLLVWCLCIGVVGARLWYCLFYDIGYYLSNPLKLFAITDGGLAIHGGIIFGIITGYVYCLKKKLNFLEILDAYMPGIMIAQAIGRWGNFINQEAHGPMVDASYFDGILFFLKDGMFINGNYYMPMFFFESLFNVIGFILIVFVVRKFQNKQGDLAWSYFLWTGALRFVIEIYRTDALLIGSLKIAQIISICYILIGILGYVGIFDKILKKPQKLH